MSKRSNACDVKNGIRNHVLDRDNNRCVVCGNTTWLQMAHVFVSRAHGGLGVPQNIATLCVVCHMSLDNGKASEANLVRELVQGYMMRKYPDLEIEKLKYKKEV